MFEEKAKISNLEDCTLEVDKLLLFVRWELDTGAKI